MTSGPSIEWSGLTSAAATARLAQIGPNELPDVRPGALRDLAARFWGPVPWMLEFGIGLELAVHHVAQAVAFTALLMINGVLAFVQQWRAAAALAALRHRLTMLARVRRDGQWGRLPVRELVPDDVVHIRLGDLVPADLRVLAGNVLIDQSAVTGESVPAEVGAGDTVFAGTLVRRGVATAQVVATGAHTAFGRAAALVDEAQSRARLDRLIVRLAGYLVAVDAVLAWVVAVYAWHVGLPLTPVLEYILILLIASVPVALPATFTLATALGARMLAARGVLVSRLAAVEDAAAMTVLCVDKTGTITRNALAVAAVEAIPPATASDVIHWAELCSDEASQDPLDLAILLAARRDRSLGTATVGRDETRERFVPFDPATKRSEALVRTNDGLVHVTKGAVQSVIALGAASPSGARALLLDAEKRLSDRGLRVLGVAAGARDEVRPVGIIGFSDPPRNDAATCLTRLRELGVRAVMVTGDAAPTAQFVANAVGMGDRVCRSDEIPDSSRLSGKPILEDCDVFAGVLPVDKVHLVAAFQRAGHVVGMTGDGVNDAAALRQADVGVAVVGAVDVAKSAASVVLTAPGLGGFLDLVDDGRRIYRRMLTYTINKVAKTFHVALFLSVGLLVTRTFVTTPMLVLLLLLANDLVTMSLATDHVRPSARPLRWNVRAVAGEALAIAFAWLVLSLAVMVVGRDLLGFRLPQLQTVAFLTLVFTGQATIYIVRCDGWFWTTRPSGYLLAGTVLALVSVSILAAVGEFMVPVAPRFIIELLLVTAAAGTMLDAIKVAISRRMNVSETTIPHREVKMRDASSPACMN